MKWSRGRLKALNSGSKLDSNPQLGDYTVHSFTPQLLIFNIEMFAAW